MYPYLSQGHYHEVRHQEPHPEFHLESPFLKLLERLHVISKSGWFGLVLWHINYFWLFNVKSSLYIRIRYMISKHILLVTFLNEPKLILLLTVKLFQVSLCIINNSIKHRSFVYPQLNDETVLFQTIQFSIRHMSAQRLNIKQICLTHI